MDTGSLRDDATPQQPSPGCGPGGCRLFTGTSNGLLTSTLRGLGPAPTGLVSCHPDVSADDAFSS